MPGWNSSPGGEDPPAQPPDQGVPGQADLTGDRRPAARERPGLWAPPRTGEGPGPWAPPRTGEGPGPWAPPRTGRGQRARRSRAKLWAGIAGGLATATVAVIVAVTVVPGSGAPATPNGAQLQQLLPASVDLPSGWYLTYIAPGRTTFLHPGAAPPVPIDACLDFSAGFDLGAVGDTFLSLASESADYGAGPGDGFLRIDLFGVMPGDAAAAIDTIRGWVRRCSSYTVKTPHFDIPYTVTAGPVPSLGDQSLDVRVTEHTPPGPGLKPSRLTDNNTLLVRVGNDLIAIECLAPPSSLITSLAGLAALMARKLPSAATLAVSRPGQRPPPPVPSPGMTAAQLERLLPRAGLPAEYTPSSLTYTDASNDGPGAVPPASPPVALSCAELPKLAGTGLTTYDVNDLNVAYLDGYSSNSDALDIVLDEASTPALAAEDVSALRQAAARCPALNTSEATVTDRYKIVVTSVAGLGDQNVNVYFRPVSSNLTLPGAQDILLVRVADALVMVDYDNSLPAGSQPGITIPPVVSIARPIVAALRTAGRSR
jgi:hypothetical protein